MSSVARVAGVSVNRAVAVLNNLEELGVVQRRDVGRSALVSLDSENEAARLLMGIAMLRERVLSRLRTTAAEIEPPPCSLVIFGSFARGDARRGSDIDVLAVLPADETEHEEYVQGVMSWGETAHRIVGNPVEVMIVRRDEMGRLSRRRGLWKTIADTGILIVGHDLNDLERVQ